ncbi:MAG TPA: hypothetical protein VGF67_17540 [Ktedonobacteraceae bacterium]
MKSRPGIDQLCPERRACLPPTRRQIWKNEQSRAGPGYNSPQRWLFAPVPVGRAGAIRIVKKAAGPFQTP